MTKNYKEYEKIIIDEVLSIDNLYYGSIRKNNQGENIYNGRDFIQYRLMEMLFQKPTRKPFTEDQELDQLPSMNKACTIVDELIKKYEFGEFEERVREFTCKLVPYLILQEKDIKELYKKGLKVNKQKNDDSITFLKFIKLHQTTANMLLGQIMDIEVFSGGGYNRNFQYKQENIDFWLKYYDFEKNRLKQKPTTKTAKYILMEPHLLPLVFGLNSITSNKQRNNFICELFTEFEFENYKKTFEPRIMDYKSIDKKIRDYLKNLISSNKDNQEIFEVFFKNPIKIVTKPLKGDELKKIKTGHSIH